MRRKRKKADYTRRRDVFTRYIDEVVNAARSITVINKEEFRKSLIHLSKRYTADADMEFDEHGKIIKKKKPGNDMGLADTIVVDREAEAPPDPTTLFDVEEAPPVKKRRATGRAKKKAKRRKGK